MTTRRLLRIERLTERDVVGYQEIRLEGLRAHPEFFGASFEEEEAQSLSSVGERWLEASSSAAMITTACKA